MRPVGLPWASCVWKMRRGRMLLGGGGRPSDVAPSPSPTPPPSRPSTPETLRPPRMGSASSFSTNGDAFFLLPRPRGIVARGRTEAGEGRRGEERGEEGGPGIPAKVPQPGVFLEPNIWNRQNLSIHSSISRLHFQTCSCFTGAIIDRVIAESGSLSHFWFPKQTFQGWLTN